VTEPGHNVFIFLDRSHIDRLFPQFPEGTQVIGQPSQALQEFDIAWSKYRPLEREYLPKSRQSIHYDPK